MTAITSIANNITNTIATARTTALGIAFAGTIAGAALLPLAAHAHGDAQLDAVTAPHGGQVRMAGPMHLELVLDQEGAEANAALKERRVTVFVTDHAGQPIATTGGSGTVTLLMGKVKVTAPLKADGDNRLSAQAAYAPVKSIKAIVSVTLPGQQAQQARFTPKAKS